MTNASGKRAGFATIGLRASLAVLACLVGPATALSGAPQAVPGASTDPFDRTMAVLASSARPAADRERDAARRARETLAFAGVRPGGRILEVIPGSGYFTRLFSLGVGPEGHVHALQPDEVVEVAPGYRPALEAIAANPQFANVEPIFHAATALALDGEVDIAFTAQNYHDFHAAFLGPLDVPALNRAIFRALRPGGVYVVIDHQAVTGSGLSAVNALHRIDRATVIEEVEAAGFILDGEGDFLANPEDPRTISVFDAGIRGRTDQFALRFRKPG